MGERVYWTDSLLRQLEAEIAEFERIAFASNGIKTVERKRQMTAAARFCSDENVRHLLGRSVGYISKHPEWIRREIGLARGHLEVLRSSNRRV